MGRTAERDVRARVHREAPTLGDLDQLNERARRLEQVLDPYALERFSVVLLERPPARLFAHIRHHSA
jgi:hypothetical protein